MQVGWAGIVSFCTGEEHQVPKWKVFCTLSEPCDELDLWAGFRGQILGGVVLDGCKLRWWGQAAHKHGAGRFAPGSDCV